MNLSVLNDTALLEATDKLVREERELLTKVLHHLREIDRRRLYSAQGFKSLFDFAVRRLGYSEDQAYRRISAMKLLKEIPEIEEKIENGEISLTHIGLAHSLFKQEKRVHSKKMSRSEKLAVFEHIAKKPVREAQRLTLAMHTSPESAKPDRINQISTSYVEVKFIVSTEIQKKVERLKGLLAHKHPNLSLGELFEKLCDLAINEWGSTKRSQIPLRISKDVFAKAENRCENCSSYYALEIDHIVPRAKGGTSCPENLRILCRKCNQRAAIEQFGQETMDRYL